MPVPFPHHYQTWLVRTLSSRGRLEAPPRPMMSPEHMLLHAVGLSLLTTFEAFAVRDRFELVTWEASVGGMVDNTASGLELTKVEVEIDMEVSDPERARAALEDAKQHCLIAKALRAPVEIDAKIRPPAVRKAG